MRTLLALFLFGSLSLRPLAADTPADLPVLGHGINIGDHLESKHPEGWTKDQKPTAEDFALIRQAGFQTVRLPICWAAVVSAGPDYTIDPAFLAYVDSVIALAQAQGLNLILDYHNDKPLLLSPDTDTPRFLATWHQIAEHFKNQPPSVLFELLNEPKEKMDAPRWNQLIAIVLADIRQTNPTRWVVVGGIYWNTIKGLDPLELPESDRHLIVTYHYYDPMTFTHQGANWVKGSNAWLGNKWLGTDAENGVIATDFDKAAAWGKTHNRPLFLGEFGAYSKGDLDSRARWTTAVARAADARGIPYAYWEFNSGFGAYDPKARQWRAPLLKALIPAAQP